MARGHAGYSEPWFVGANIEGKYHVLPMPGKDWPHTTKYGPMSIITHLWKLCYPHLVVGAHEVTRTHIEQL